MDETKIEKLIGWMVSTYVRQDTHGDDEIEAPGGAVATLFNIEPSSIHVAALESVRGLLVRWLQFEKTGPLSATYVPRLIDPLPEQLDTADNDVAGGRVGKALSRIGFSKPTELLFVNNRDQITTVERRVIHRFAMDLRFPKASWPSWMA